MYTAPEIVLQKPYDSKADVWSGGIVAHVLLSGITPFMGDTNEETWKKIAHDPVDFNLKWLDKASDKAKEWLKRALDKNPKTRATAEELLNHNWLANVETSPIFEYKQSLEHVSENLSNFIKSNSFMKTIISILAGLMIQATEIKHLKSMFLKWDTDQNGTLCVDELKQALSTCQFQELFQNFGTDNETEPDYDSLLQMIDVNND